MSLTIKNMTRWTGPTPGDNLAEVVVQADTSLGVEGGRGVVADEVGGDDGVVGVGKNALERTLSGLLHGLLDGLVGGRLLKTSGQIDNGHVGAKSQQIKRKKTCQSCVK